MPTDRTAMPRRLNGWQRLWCGAALVLLGLFGVNAYRHLPTAQDIRAQAQEKALLVEQEQGAPPPDSGPCQGVMTQYDRSMCEMKSDSAPIPAQVQTGASIRQQAEVDIRERLPGWRIVAVLSNLAMWVAAVAALYGAGWVVGRMIRKAGPVSPRSSDAS